MKNFKISPEVFLIEWGLIKIQKAPLNKYSYIAKFNLFIISDANKRM